MDDTYTSCHFPLCAGITDYSVSSGEQVVRRGKELAESLITKYNDGYVKDGSGEPQELGCLKEWLRAVVKSDPGRFKLPGDGVIKSPASYYIRAALNPQGRD